MLALKKHLAKMEIKPGDLVLLKLPAIAPESSWRGFAEEVARQLKEQGCGPLLVVRPGFDLGTMSDEALAKHELVRVPKDETLSEEAKRFYKALGVRDAS